MGEYFLVSMGHLIEPLNILLMIIGITGGICVGALPGLSATMGVALMVPVTFAMNPISGLIMLGAIYAGAVYGGANSAILICTPGTPASVATTFDGWPFCKKGKADEALYTALIASAFGGIVGTILLLFIAEPLARVAVKFGGPQNFWLCVFGLSTIGVMASDNMVKGLLSAALGLLISTIGIDPLTGAQRFTFGTYELVQGIAVIPAMIGLFSFSQVLSLIESQQTHIAEYNPKKGVFMQSVKNIFGKCKINLVRSSTIGSVVGMLPGAGGEIASIISYNQAKSWDKDPCKYGTGVTEGVVATESANNAVIGGALIPMLTLGIPGSAVTAVILGSLMAHGIQPGFKIFENTGDLAYTFIYSQFAVNLLMIPIGFFLAKLMGRMLNLKLTYVAIGIVMLAVIGSYAINNSMVDVWTVIMFGFIGFICNKVGMDKGALALGVILGPMVEENLGKCINLSDATGSLLGVFVEGTISKVLIAIIFLSLISPIFIERKKKKNQEAAKLLECEE